MIYHLYDRHTSLSVLLISGREMTTLRRENILTTADRGGHTLLFPCRASLSLCPSIYSDAWRTFSIPEREENTVSHIHVDRHHTVRLHLFQIHSNHEILQHCFTLVSVGDRGLSVRLAIERVRRRCTLRSAAASRSPLDSSRPVTRRRPKAKVNAVCTKVDAVAR